MQTYLNLIKHVLENGEVRPNRTGISTRSVFGLNARYDLREGFPLLTTKKMAFNQIKGELIGFIQGFTSAAQFREIGCTIWDANANENKNWLANLARHGKDDLGRIYGAQWRNWLTEYYRVDQLTQVINALKFDPYNRRHLVTAWNPGELDNMALPPCHVMFQFYVSNDGHLDLSMYQRSADMFLGVPFNIASYSLLLSMVAQVTGYKPRYFVHFIGDAHIYENHLEQVKEQLNRTPMPRTTLWLRSGINDIDDFTPEDIDIGGYIYHPALPAPMAV